MFSTPVCILSLGMEVSWFESSFNSPLIGNKTGVGVALARKTFSFFSSICLPLSFANCLA